MLELDYPVQEFKRMTMCMFSSNRRTSCHTLKAYPVDEIVQNFGAFENLSILDIYSFELGNVHVMHA